MANAMTYEFGNARFGGAAGWLARARKAVADYALYHRTRSELSALGPRGLDDMGVSRLAIRRIARDSVYGA